MKLKKHIPNILSTVRLIMAIGLPFVFLSLSSLTTLIYYVIGASTDFIDGNLARRWKVQSRYGKIVDPIADKSINGIMIILNSLFINPLMWLLLGMEGAIATITILRSKNNRDMDVSKIGKVKTVILGFATALTALSAIVPSSEIIQSFMTTFIALTFGLQTVTAFTYADSYIEERREIKQAKIKNEKVSSIDNSIEINKLKLLRNKANRLKNMWKPKSTSSEIHTYQEPEINNLPLSEDEKDNGNSKTLR